MRYEVLLTTPSLPAVLVDAAYWMIEDGALVFYRYAASRDTSTARRATAFGPHSWLSVEENKP